MIAFFSPDHSLHAPEYEFYRGQRAPCFETPAEQAMCAPNCWRVGTVCARLMEQIHG